MSSSCAHQRRRLETADSRGNLPSEWNRHFCDSFLRSQKLVRSVRGGRNQRLVSRRELRILAYIKVAQRLGFSLEEIKHAFRDLPPDRVPSKADWQKVSRAWNKTLEEKIALATRMRNQLNLCIGCGCLSLKDCPLRNPDDELARQGSGPRLL